MGFVTYCVGKLAYIEVLFLQNIRQHVIWFLIIILDIFILIINSNEDLFVLLPKVGTGQNDRQGKNLTGQLRILAGIHPWKVELSVVELKIIWFGGCFVWANTALCGQNPHCEIITVRLFIIGYCLQQSYF
jgi:hypothetical protein